MNSEDLNVVMKSFKYSTSTDLKKSRPCRMKIDGKFITTVSGKTVWRRTCDAKNALHHHIKRVVGYGVAKEVYNHLISNSLVEFVPLSDLCISDLTRVENGL